MQKNILKISLSFLRVFTRRLSCHLLAVKPVDLICWVENRQVIVLGVLYVIFGKMWRFTQRCHTIWAESVGMMHVYGLAFGALPIRRAFLCFYKWQPVTCQQRFVLVNDTILAKECPKFLLFIFHILTRGNTKNRFCQTCYGIWKTICDGVPFGKVFYPFLLSHNANHWTDIFIESFVRDIDCRCQIAQSEFFKRTFFIAKNTG